MAKALFFAFNMFSLANSNRVFSLLLYDKLSPPQMNWQEAETDIFLR